MEKNFPLIAVVGPTGSGKSALGIALAHAVGGEIVNCDSIQLYRLMDIGSAKTPAAERQDIPHHLFDILNPDQLFTAADYIRVARPVLRQIAARGQVPILVGGTGFYFRALLYGLFEGPARNEALRERLQRRSPQRLHRMLTRFDSEASGRIHVNDTKKVIRALEICLLTRKPVTEQYQVNQSKLEGFSLLTLGLDPPRDQLAQNINQRCQQMFSAGLVEEVRRILALGFPASSKALESIGYREALSHIEGNISYQDAVLQTQTSTRQYAKRQRTWFRRERDVHWLNSFGNHEQTIDEAKRLVDLHIKNI